MWTLLTVLVIIGALAAFVTAVSALGAYLGYRRTRYALQVGVLTEVAQLAGRASELEESLAALDARANALPIRIQELQRNLSTLRVLTGALTVSLRQAQRVLSTDGLKSSLAAPLARLSGGIQRNGR
jgi:hypothetical protein